MVVTAGAQSNSNTSTVTTSRTTGVPPTRPPAIAGARLTNRRFRVGRQATAISAARAPTRHRVSLHPVRARQASDSDHALGAGAAPRQELPGAEQPAQTRARQALHPHADARHADTGQRARGADSVSFSGRIGHSALSPRSLQRAAQREQRRRALKDRQAQLHDRPLAPGRPADPGPWSTTTSATTASRSFSFTPASDRLGQRSPDARSGRHAVLPTGANLAPAIRARATVSGPPHGCA